MCDCSAVNRCASKLAISVCGGVEGIYYIFNAETTTLTAG